MTKTLQLTYSFESYTIIFYKCLQGMNVVKSEHTMYFKYKKKPSKHYSHFLYTFHVHRFIYIVPLNDLNTHIHQINYTKIPSKDTTDSLRSSFPSY